MGYTPYCQGFCVLAEQSGSTFTQTQSIAAQIKSTHVSTLVGFGGLDSASGRLAWNVEKTVSKMYRHNADVPGVLFLFYSA